MSKCKDICYDDDSHIHATARTLTDNTELLGGRGFRILIRNEYRSSSAGSRLLFAMFYRLPDHYGKLDWLLRPRGVIVTQHNVVAGFEAERFVEHSVVAYI